MSSRQNKHSHGDRIRLLRLTSLYAVIMLLIIASITLFIRRTPETYISDTDTVKLSEYTEYVYVRPDVMSESPTNTDISNELQIYTVREYMGKVGIFLSDGTLIELLDVYTKTLPETDRRLLKEGIEIIGKQQLNSIIEDYTS